MASSVNSQNNSSAALSALAHAEGNALTAIGITAERYAKENITSAGIVDSGRLLNSISFVVEGKSVYIGTNVPYAVWHEVGTGIHASDGQGRKSKWVYFDPIKGQFFTTNGVKPRHFLKRAAEEHTDNYKSLLEQALKSAE